MKVKVYDVATLNKSNFDFNNNHSSILYLDTSSITRNEISDFKEYASNSEEIPSRAKRAVEKDTIIISTVRPNLEHYGFLEMPSNNTVVSTGFVTVHADRTKVNPKYLYYLLTSPKAVAYLTAIANTAVSSYPSFNPDDLGNYELDILDSIEEQKKIVQVLSSLDAKISLNRSIISDLESLSRQIYDYWFVQFDFPDEHGRPYKSSGGKMVWNDKLKRYIPAAWEVKTLGDVLDIKYGKEHKKLGNGIIPVYGSGGLMRKVDKPLYTGEAVLIPRKGTLNNVMYVDGAFWTVDTMFYGIQKIPSVTKYIYQILKAINLAKLNCGSAVPSMTTEILNSLFIVMPEESILKQYDAIISSFYQQICKCSHENESLTSLRDFLLPMLMNGQVTVK